MVRYNPAKTEKKWQKYWQAKKLYEAKDTQKGSPPSRKASDGQGKNFMLLAEFPYPSGNLHVGHWYTFAVTDILARRLRMDGGNVMYPIGFDAFGLPAENAAIKRDIHPEKWTKQNIAYMTKQLESMGATFDWSRVVSTIDPEYYKWTQWMFLKMYEKGLAYRQKTKANWCPKDKTILANEQVVTRSTSSGQASCCERCYTPVEQREIEQWMYKITDYADSLIDDMEGLDWPMTTMSAQKNWIGRSRGAQIKWSLRVDGQSDGKHSVETFTTRADTIFGATFLVISPEVAKKWLDVGWKAPDNVKKYITQALGKRELERQEEKEKTGVDTGVKAISPMSGGEIPVWVADYVLGSYGTGAIMAVPAHDERDFEFAKKFNLPITEVISGGDITQKAFSGEGPLVNSGKFDGVQGPDAGVKITEELEAVGSGNFKTTYRLRDWILSRQRYWGCPIPLIKCPKCGYQPVPEKDLPVKLPPLKDFKPADDGRSPLAKAKSWLKVKCPQCKGNAERETDTMDTFVDSSWYFIRYTDPKNKKSFADIKKSQAWLPVPMYIGGAEHNTMHLLYSRFFWKVLADLGYVKGKEPFTGRRNHGIVLGPDGQKMSKSRGNVVDPDELVKNYGADTVRMYLAFMAPYEQGGPWDPKGINGITRFLQRTLTLAENHNESSGAKPDPGILHRTIKKVGEDIKELKYNTAVSEMMKLLNNLEACRVDAKTIEVFTKLLAPFAPHIAEEIWMVILKKKKSVHLEKWPEYDPLLLLESSINVPIQINGKVREVLVVPADITEEKIRALALSNDTVKKNLEGREVKKVIYIKGRMISIVV